MKHAPYGWLITRDSITDSPESPHPTNDNALGMTGPRNISDAVERRLRLAARKGRNNHDDPAVTFFKMYDDDGFLYYTGAYVVVRGHEDECDGFEPLDDFGTPNAGAVRIDYYKGLDFNNREIWKTL